MDRINYEQIQYGPLEDVKTIVTNLLQVYPHWHNEIELIYSLRGTLRFSAGGKEFNLEEGSVCLVNSMEAHAVYSLPDEKNRDDNLVMLLQFSERFMRSLFSDVTANRFTRLPEDSPELLEVRRLLLDILNESLGQRKERASIIHGFSAAVMALLIRRFSLSSSQQHSDSGEYDRNSERIKKILKFVSEHYAETPSLAEAAEVVHVTPNHLSHFFTAALGISYTQYLNYVKADHARQELLAGDAKIIDIMEKIGFANLKTFNAVFKEHFKTTPGSYRKEMRQEIHRRNGGQHIESSLRSDFSTTPGSYINFKSAVTAPKTALLDTPKEKSGAAIPAKKVPVKIDAAKQTGRLSPYYQHTIGLARASDILRKTVQEQILLVQKEIGFQYIRFHGIFNDEMCLLNRDSDAYNWMYIDEVYDFLLSAGLKPFVELSFMPTGLAQGATTVFYYKANITPPRNYKEWGALVEAFARHLLERYGIAEVSTWYFEVWNEPNLGDFWPAGFDEYMRLYETSAESIKKAAPGLRVGGPALSSNAEKDASAFLNNFLAACRTKKLPLDFVSVHPYQTHIYQNPDETWVVQREAGGTFRDMNALHTALEKTGFPALEIHLSEWNSSPLSDDPAHDTAFMAVFILQNYIQCRGLCHSLAYWSLSDRLEEGGLPAQEFSGGFGLLSVSGLKKPAFYAFKALSLLGEDIIESGEQYIVTRKAQSGEIQVLAWNYAHFNTAYAEGNMKANYYKPYEMFEEGHTILFSCTLENEQIDADADAHYIIEKTLFDRKHGSVFDFWLENGALDKFHPKQTALFNEQCRPERSVQRLRSGKGGVRFEQTLEPFAFVLWQVTHFS
jgi:xylan 1,4-beta-xylosidase